MEESRHIGRSRAILGAHIIFNNRNSTIECQVRNLSAKGARLTFTDAVSVPEEFELHVPLKGRSYRAQLRWRDSEGAGVEFMDSGLGDAPERAQDATRRVAELETENAALRLKIVELTQRLQASPSAGERAA